MFSSIVLPLDLEADRPSRLGVHTELISDGVKELMELGVVTGVAKQINRTKTVGTFALGTQDLYDFLHENTAWRALAGQLRERSKSHRPGTELRLDQRHHRCRPPGAVRGRRPSRAYYSSSGGQADFARGALYSAGGQGFVVLHSTTRDGVISKIVPQLAAGDVVTTLKNTVDKIVTEWGVAEHVAGPSGSVPSPSQGSRTPTTVIT